MKYMRKTPVEAIQWNGHNQNEVSEFISHATKSYSMWSDGFDNLDITYSFQKGRTSRAVIPLFGWVVKTRNKDMTLNEYQNHALETAIYPEEFKKGGLIK